MKALKIHSPSDASTKPKEMPILLDPKSDRPVKELIPPVHRPLSNELLFGSGIYY